MWIRSCGLCREAVARVVFSTIRIREHWSVTSKLDSPAIFCVVPFVSKTGKGRFFFWMSGSIACWARLWGSRSIPSVNNSGARKFSLLSRKFSHAELLGSSAFQFFLFYVYCYIYSTHIYIFIRLETCNYVYIDVYIETWEQGAL